MSLYAFCLYKYFPFGGLERDFLRIATACHEKGHSIRVYTLSWQGPLPAFIDLRIVPVRAIQNHVVYRRFQRWVAEDLQQSPVDRTIGFNKMPGLDFYYAADICYIDTIKQPVPWYYHFNPRFKEFYKNEKSVFSPLAKTQVLLLTLQQKQAFQKAYHTPDNRLHILPPGISPDRLRPDNAESIRNALRLEFALKHDDILLLMVGSGFKTKGVDRALLAFCALAPTVQQSCKLIIIGQDKAAPFLQLSRRLNIADRVHILPGRNDIPRFLLGADLLLHPAYRESAGMILLEALLAGLPVLVSDVCGYAHYIEKARCGALITSPFKQEAFNALLVKAIEDKNLREHWQAQGLEYAKTADLFSLVEKAVYIIETNTLPAPAHEETE